MPKLTKKNIEKMLLPESGQQLVWDTELKGFGIRLTPGGKAFVVQGRVNGINRRVKIASCETFSPDEARKRARSFLQDMADGTDPNAEKKNKIAKTITMEEVAQDYITDRALKASSRNDINKHLNGIFKSWKAQPVTTINRDMVLKLFRQRSEISPAQANQAFRILRGLFNYIMATYRPGNIPIVSENPVQVISDAKIWNNIKPKNRRIPLDKVGQAWAMLQDMQAHPAQTLAGRSMVDAVIFALLTGARWGECQGLTWDNVNPEAGTWHIPDPKNKKAVTLPLSDQAQHILENRTRIDGNPYVFCSNKSQTGYIGPGRWVTDQLSAADALGVELSAHDLRRTFRSIAAELDIELWRTKLLMNHRISNDITIAAYTEKSDLEYLRTSIQAIGDWIEYQGKLFRNKIVDINTARGAI
nr:tyrosine-type recombinase/integrase [Desulfobacula sp.]